MRDHEILPGALDCLTSRSVVGSPSVSQTSIGTTSHNVTKIPCDTGGHRRDGLLKVGLGLWVPNDTFYHNEYQYQSKNY